MQEQFMHGLTNGSNGIEYLGMSKESDAVAQAISALKVTGNMNDILVANAFQALLEMRSKEPEVNDAVVPDEFSTEALAQLKERKCPVYSLNGESIRSLKLAGRKFKLTWHINYPKFEALKSKSTQVAIVPSMLFLPDSNNKTLDQQLTLIDIFSEQVSHEIKGVRAIMGDAPECIELAFLHFDATGEDLFNGNSTRTQTIVGSNSIKIGPFDEKGGLSIDGWGPTGISPNIFAMPLLVPARLG